MKPKPAPYSLVKRRTFLTRVGALLGAGFVAQLLGPLARFVFPGNVREPDSVTFTDPQLAELSALAAGECLRFAWGGVPGLLVRSRDGELRAFKGVCTHADCNVAWRATSQDFFCACHEGVYDANGVNIAGPPPRPLATLHLETDTDARGRFTAMTIHRRPPEDRDA